MDVTERVLGAAWDLDRTLVGSALKSRKAN